MNTDEVLAALFRRIINGDGIDPYYGGYVSYSANGSPHFPGDGNGSITLDLTIDITAEELAALNDADRGEER